MTNRREELFVEAAKKLNQSLQLENVLFVKIDAQLNTLSSEPNFAFSMALGEVNWARLDAGVLADFPVEVGIQDKRQGSEPVDLAIIRVALRAAYSSQTLSPEQEDAVPDFLGIVGWMHAWPYLRAEVQSISTKFGLPALTLPLLLTGQTSKIPVVRELMERAVATGQVLVEAQTTD
jgi:hypothetical protein